MRAIELLFIKYIRKRQIVLNCCAQWLYKLLISRRGNLGMREREEVIIVTLFLILTFNSLFVPIIGVLSSLGLQDVSVNIRVLFLYSRC